MISIVIPLYNKREYVAETLKSILNQTYDDWEAIVINDGSTDESEIVVHTFEDKRIQLYNTKNKGVSAARNLGISKAKFEWIAFLDADDWWDKEFLASVFRSIQNHPKEKLFTTGRTRVFEDHLDRYKHSLLPNEGKTEILDYVRVLGKGGLPAINASSTVISKPLLLEKNGFKENMKAHEDHEFWLRLTAENQIVFINKPLSFYRKVDDEKRRVFSAVDFMMYLNTLQKVMKTLTPKRGKYLKSYCNRFITWSFYKNRKNYSPVEKNGIIKQSYGLISLFSKGILWILYRL